MIIPSAMANEYACLFSAANDPIFLINAVLPAGSLDYYIGIHGG